MKIQEFITAKLYQVRRYFKPLSKFDREAMTWRHLHHWESMPMKAVLKHGWNESRIAMEQAARAADWRIVKRLLERGENPNDYQVCTPEWNCVLHWAAEKNAPASLIRLALACGAWRTLPNAAGMLPCEIALARGHHALAEILQPKFTRPFDPIKLAATQVRLHAHLLENELIIEHQLRLPELPVLMELQEPRMIFHVPGMYGSYFFEIEESDDQHSIIFERTSRIVGGPVPRYGCSPEGVTRLPSVRNQ